MLNCVVSNVVWDARSVMGVLYAVMEFCLHTNNVVYLLSVYACQWDWDDDGVSIHLPRGCCKLRLNRDNNQSRSAFV